MLKPMLIEKAIELKPCPFCGNEANLLKDTHENSDTSQWHEIQCSNVFRCGAKMGTAISEWQNDYKDEVLALIDRWNTRTSKVAPKKREQKAGGEDG